MSLERRQYVPWGVGGFFPGNDAHALRMRSMMGVRWWRRIFFMRIAHRQKGGYGNTVSLRSIPVEGD